VTHRTGDEARPSVQPFVLVGLGALNLDFITSGYAGVVEDHESWVGSDEMDKLLEKAGGGGKPFLGGSAFNTLLLLGQSQLNNEHLRLGMIGSQSETARHHATYSHSQALEAAGVRSLIYDTPGPPGRALSRSGPNGRSISVSPGANLSISRVLSDNRDFLLRELRGVQYLHLTSLLERERSGQEEVAVSVLDFVRAVRAPAVSPGVIVSLDPGDTWVAERRMPAIAALFGEADLLFFNSQEFRSLTGRTVDNPEAVRSLYTLCPRAAVYVLKGHEEVRLVHPSGLLLSESTQREYVKAIDPTGAGDAFAAGVLGGLLRDHTLSTSADFGLRLASIRVRGRGDEAQVRLPDPRLWDPQKRSTIARLVRPERLEERILQLGGIAAAIAAVIGLIALVAKLL
jgi:sugar/nucleoside kinase (ribokinase family)